MLAGEASWDDVHSTVTERRGWLTQFVSEHGVQTNEVQRCFGLLPGFLTLGNGQPLDVIELGPSAGLNLIWDRYRYVYDGEAWGPETAPLVQHTLRATNPRGTATPNFCSSSFP